MFEKLIPAIAKTLKLDKQGNYSDIVLALLERAALRQNLERFKVYSFSEFLDILDPHIQSLPPARSKLVRIMKKSDLLPGSLREDVFNTLTTLLIHIIRKGSDPK
jgi:NTE family protein